MEQRKNPKLLLALSICLTCCKTLCSGSLCPVEREGGMCLCVFIDHEYLFCAGFRYSLSSEDPQSSSQTWHLFSHVEDLCACKVCFRSHFVYTSPRVFSRGSSVITVLLVFFRGYDVFCPWSWQQSWLLEQCAGWTCRLVRHSVVAGGEMWVRQGSCLACSYGRTSKSRRCDFASKVVWKTATTQSVHAFLA